MNCENFTFLTGKYLTTTCNLSNNSNNIYTDSFTGISGLNVSCNTGGYCAFLCEYDDSSLTNGYRTRLTSGSIEINPYKYYVISGQNSVDLSVSPICITNSFENVYNKLNSITNNDIYNEINTITPFLIFLVIFSFSFFVLRKIIRSSSNGKANL